MTADARLPVLLHAEPHIMADGAAWLVEGDALAPDGPVERFVIGSPHAPGCACCLPRGHVAEALRRLFLRRARGEVPPFDRVVLIGSSAGADATQAALCEDLFVAARYRPG